jgi:SAM-dependent methyltransferase
MEYIKKCPLCQSGTFKDYIHAVDHYYSHEKFIVVECENCGFRFTNPRPEEKSSHNYYQNENYISHNASKKGLMPFLYYQARNYSIKKKFNLVSSFCQKGKILDYGCGSAGLLAYFKNNGWDVIGIESGDYARTEAMDNYGLEVFDESFLSGIPDDSIDVISLWHVLEHVYPLSQRIQDFKRILKPNSYLVIALPNCMSYDASLYADFWAAWDLPRHIYHFTPPSIINLMKKNDIKHLKTFPLKLDAYYISLLSEKYKKNPFGYFSALKNAFLSNYKASKRNGNYSSLIYVFTV